MGIQRYTHRPCTVCDSSDAMTVYEDEAKGIRYGICYSNTCPSGGKAIKNLPDEYKGTEDVDKPKTLRKDPITFESLSETWVVSEPPNDSWRGVSVVAGRDYQITDVDGQVVFPYLDSKQNLVGFKVRFKDKKEFYVKTKEGETLKNYLFGTHRLTGGKAITITEGEIDAISVYQLFGNRYDVVSIPLGAGSALVSCKANFEILNKYNDIVLSFDMDEEGQKAASQVAELFPGKVRVMKMRHKDANQYLERGEDNEFITDWWNAPKYMPDGIISGKDIWERLNKPQSDPICLFPWPMLNDKLFGLYPQRIYTFTGGSGLGKSQVVRELAYHVWAKSDHKIGILMLEESIEDSANGLISLFLNKPLHIPTTKYTAEEYRQAYDSLFVFDRIYFHDHFGSTVISNILNRVSYMIRVLGCKVIVLDHLSIVVSGQDNPDERKAIDELMTKLRTLVQATGATLILVSHLSKHPKKIWTKGAEVSGHDLRGSASIEQLSDTIIAIERNLQSEKD